MMTKARFNKLLGMCVQRRRHNRNMTMEEVAKESGTNKSTIHSIEHGVSSPVIFTLVRVCDALSCDLTELIKETKRMDRIMSQTAEGENYELK